MKKKLIVLICVSIFTGLLIFVAARELYLFGEFLSEMRFSWAEVNMETEIIGSRQLEPPNEHLTHTLMRSGNSVIFTVWNGERTSSYRYMDVTSILDADEFNRILNRIKRNGVQVESAHPKTELWIIMHRFGEVIATTIYGQFVWTGPGQHRIPRYSIEINEDTDERADVYGRFELIYYPEDWIEIGDDVEELSSVWSYNVPFYQDGHVFVRVVNNSMTDSELLQEVRRQVRNLRRIW